MAFDFSNFNNGADRVCRAGVDSRDFKFTHIKDYVGESIKVNGWFITESTLGGKTVSQPVVIGEESNINFLSWATDRFKKLAADPDAVKAVLAGELCITNIHVIPAKEKGFKDTWGFDFANVADIK